MLVHVRQQVLFPWQHQRRMRDRLLIQRQPAEREHRVWLILHRAELQTLQGQVPSGQQADYNQLSAGGVIIFPGIVL